MPKIPPVQPSSGQRAHAIRRVTHAPAPPRSGTFHVAKTRLPSAPGNFEIVRADGGGFLIRMLDGNGAVLALSRAYADIAAAVEGVETVRECAAAAHISDETALPPVPEPVTPPLQ